MKKKISIHILDQDTEEKELRALYQGFENTINRYVNGAEQVKEDLFLRMPGEILVFSIEGIRYCGRIKKTTLSYSDTILRTVSIKLIFTKR